MQISAIPAVTSVAQTPIASEPIATINPATDPVTTPEPTTPTPTPTTPPSKFLQKLASGHFNPVADLRHRMHLAQEIKDSGITLPEPAAPKGHGKAYAKFLAAYRAMAPSAPAAPAEPVAPTGTTTTTEPASPTPVNVEA